MPSWVPAKDFEIMGIWNHSDLDGSRSIYRYLSIDGAIDTFRSSSFLMKMPQRWDDPFEDWWCKKLFVSPPDVRQTVYGLCWTTRNRDEPFWRMYTCPQNPTVPAIRIRTSVAELNRVVRGVILHSTGEAYLGRVRYAKTGFLKERAISLVNSGSRPLNIINPATLNGALTRRSESVGV
jgi:hypothetical protein